MSFLIKTISWIYSWLSLIILLSAIFLVILPFMGIDPLKYIVYYFWVIFLYLVYRMTLKTTEVREKYIIFPYKYGDMPGLFRRFCAVIFIAILGNILVEPIVSFIGGDTTYIYNYWFSWFTFVSILYVLLAF